MLPDIHVPVHDQRSIDAVLTYANLNGPWEGVIQLGDFMSLDLISDYVRGRPRKVESRRLKAEFAKGKALLNEIEDATQARQYFMIEGNHDERMVRYIDAHPETEGLVEVPEQLELAGRGWKWVPFASKGTILSVGKANFIHGIYTNDTHAKKTVEAYGCNVFYGHCHDFQSYSKVMIGDDSTMMGQSLGCLCKYNPYYLKGYPNRWQQGFAVFHFMPDGSFTYYPISIFDHKFVGPDGRMYRG